MVTIGKMGHTCEKGVTFVKKGSYLEKGHTLAEMGHTCNIESHLQH